MKQIKLTLPRRTPPQIRIQKSHKRFKVGVWGRQSGKTTNGTWTMLKRPIEGPRLGVYWHILQTYNAAEIAFNRYVRLFPKDSWTTLWAKKPNESEKCVYLTGHREVHFKSGFNFEDLRAETLSGAIIDECRQQNPELWRSVIRPMLARFQGWAEFYSTPNGFDWFYDLRNEGLENPSEWDVIHAPSTEAWWWTPEEIESARKTMPEALFAQEILAEFRDIYRGKAYINFTQENQLEKSPFVAEHHPHLFNPYLPIVLGLDFNVSPMIWEIGQVKNLESYWFDEIALDDTNTPEAADAFIARVLEMKSLGLKAQPNVILVGDASGNARSTASAGLTDYMILEQKLKSAGITFENKTPQSNPLVKDRVNTVNFRLKSSEGPQLFIHPTKCPRLKKDLERVAWKDAQGAILDKTTDKTLTHASDALGYPICTLTPLTNLQGAGTLRIIQRGI